MRTSVPRGTFDIMPEEALQWGWMESLIRDVFLAYGFGEIRTPIFEHTELFQRGIGETTDIVEKEMYTLTDKGGRSITLRPEGTAPVVRAYIEHKVYSRSGAAKLFYMGPMFRQERPQAGRFRQFHQFGVEILGEEGPMADAEVITLAVDLYERLGLTGLEVLLNSIGCPECRGEYRKVLLESLRPKTAELCESCRNRLERNPLRLLDCKSPYCQEAVANIPSIQDYLCTECKEHFSAVLTLLDRVNIKYEVNPRLVRGFDYYTKTVFEIINKDLGAQNAVCGGGRYDRLVEECGGPPTPGVGFASGMERLLSTLKQKGRLPEFSLAPQAYLTVLSKDLLPVGYELATILRRTGVRTVIGFNVKSLKAQMKAADRSNARFTLILGEDEWSKRQVTVRRMSDGEQWQVDWEKTPEFLSGMLGEEES